MKEIEGIAEGQASNIDDSRLKKAISNIISWRNPVLKSVIHHDDQNLFKSTKPKQILREKSTPILSKTLSAYHTQSAVHAAAETPLNEK